MAFIVKKKINNQEYYYLRESKREEGKVKAKTIAYLGKDLKTAQKKARQIQQSPTKEQQKPLSPKKAKPNSMSPQKQISPESKDFTSFVQESGLIWGPEPEIYGGLAGFYTYGPLGKLLKNKVENSVRRVFNSHGFREIEGPTVLPDVVWKASGHLDTFEDRIIKCSKCKSVFRADKIIEESHDISADAFSNKEILDFIKKHNIVCPSCKAQLEKKISSQSLMMKTNVAGQDASLRPETATVTYLPFLRYYHYFRKKPFFAVFQIGKAYRNEISPRQSVLRGREFTQAEGQIFIDPELKNKWEKYEEIKEESLPFYTSEQQKSKSPPKPTKIKSALSKKLIKSQVYAWCLYIAYMQFVNFGIPKERIRLRQHHEDEKAFYADDAWDIEIKLNNFNWVEVCGVHDRTDYDLKQHSEHSKISLKSKRENGKEFTPHVLEIAFGTDRPTYTLIDLFYEKKTEEQGKTKFAIPYHMAPIDCSILPLMKKPELVKLAQDIKIELERDFIVDYDQSSSIGKRYLRSSTQGTPFAITIDYNSLNNNDVTIRDRDTEKQIRVSIPDLRKIIHNLINGELEFEDAGKTKL
ncbi:MAG: glycine--tRNA ligase [archaeon]